MAQCKKYPKGCNGLVRRDSKDKNWYCEKHFYDLDHMKATDRKVTLKEKKEKEKVKKEKEEDE